MPRKKSKRAAKGEGCIRQRKDGRWEWIPPKKYNLTPKYGRSEAEVSEIKLATLGSLREGTYVDPSAYTVSTWADYYFESLYNRQNVDTRAPVHSHLKIHIKPFFGAMKLQDVGKEDVVRFHKALVDKELATHTIENIHSTLVQLFDSAIPKRIRVNPAKGIKIEQGVKAEMLYFREDQYLDFLEALENPKACSYFEACLFRLALYTGMREGELLGLDWKHIDFENGKILIHQQLKMLRPVNGVKGLPNKNYYIRAVDENYYLALPKYQKKRHLQPGAKAMEMLREVKAKQVEERLRTGMGDAYNPNGFVFVTGTGRHMVNTTILPRFKKIVVSIGGKREMRIHDLRHSYVYNALASGLTYDQISENLGHKSVDFTKHQYGHFPDALHEDAAGKMDAYYKKMEEKQAERKAKKDEKTQAT